MLKLYRIANGLEEYWEAWATGREITVHCGKLGEEGETKETRLEPGVHPDETIKRLAKPIRAAGFKSLKESDLHTIVVQYRIDGMGSDDDLDKRISVEKLMNECLGWTGLGHCDGGDIGSGTMNVFCLVANPRIAESVIIRDLNANGLLTDAVIAERTGDGYKVLWRRNFVGNFSI